MWKIRRKKVWIFSKCTVYVSDKFEEMAKIVYKKLPNYPFILI